MKILVVSQKFYPEQFRVNEIVEELVKRGHGVTVLAGVPNYPTGIVPEEYRNGKNRTQNLFGAKVIRAYEKPRKDNAVGLFLNYLSFMVSGTFKALFMKEKYDVVYVYEVSPVTMIVPAIAYGKKNKVPVFCYCLDLWPESIKNIIKNEDSIIYKFTKVFSGWIYKAVDRIGVTSLPFIDYFKKVHGIDEDKVVYLPQHGDQAQKIEPESHKTTNFLYAGNLGIAQGLEVFIEAAKKIKDQGFMIHFVGDGIQREHLKELVKQYGLEEQIVFHGSFKPDQLDEFYKLADVCILSLNSDSFIGQTMPAKLQSYMSYGKPIMASIEGSAEQVIRDSKSGYSAKYGEIDELARIMKEFIEMDYDKLKVLGDNAYKYYLENFTMEKHIDKLEIEFEDLIGEKNV